MNFAEAAYEKTILEIPAPARPYVHVVEVTTEQHLQNFIDLPWEIYKGCKQWVPVLDNQARDLLDTRKNPFFKHAELKLFLAYRNGKAVGRVAGIIDHAANTYRKERAASFGFFECIDDALIARSLLDQVSRWAVLKGTNILRGPYNPSPNHECGLLIEGFNLSPTLMLPYNHEYYVALLEGCGFRKIRDMYAYTYDSQKTAFPENLHTHAERLKRKHPEITFRDLNMKKFDDELKSILEIYNDSMDVQWDFTPMTKEELDFMAHELKPFVDPTLFFIIEVAGKPAGFAFAFPDINQALQKLSSGRSSPRSLIQLWWNLKGPGRAKTITRCRFIALGVKKEFRHLALGPLFYVEFLNRCAAAGYAEGEASWVLEDNHAINRAHRRMGGKITKQYRIVEKELGI